VPLRFFFGLTFLYAGLDKLLDPTFFDAANPTSMHGQLLAFARVSPLGDLIRLSLPLATPIGLAIAVGEIGVGVGTLTGLAFRVAAAGGAALSILFWLTASWATHPYYYGGDLPYAFGWITLALAGHGGLFVSSRFFAAPAAASASVSASGPRAAPVSAPVSGPGSAARRDVVTSPERRALLQTGLLAATSLIVASLALPLRALGIRLGGTGIADGGTATTTPGPSPAPGASAAPETSAAPGASAAPSPAAGISIATIADVEAAGSAVFTVPVNAPSPLPVGAPGVVIKLPDGTFVAFDTICTHAGCTVEWDAADAVLLCPCHDAFFDAAHGGAVLGGPAPSPLASLPIVVDHASGMILLGG
jgi:thiosulfate dehydrogenase [quinone] large subunit